MYLNVLLLLNNWEKFKVWKILKKPKKKKKKRQKKTSYGYRLINYIFIVSVTQNKTTIMFFSYGFWIHRILNHTL